MIATGPVEHPCHICGERDAAFGFGWPGLSKDRPDDAILWGCAHHREEVRRINHGRIGGKLTV